MKINPELVARMAPITFDDACWLLGVPPRNGRTSACCPLHEDRVASMTLSEVDGERWLAYCHVCCSEDHREWYGQFMHLLRSWRAGGAPAERAAYVAQAVPVHRSHRQHVENYDYPGGVRKARYRLVVSRTGVPLCDLATGKQLKTFMWLYWDEATKQWLYGRPRSWMPRWYGEDQLGGSGDPVWVCEGERDSNRLRSLGVLAVCAPDGAASRALPDAAALAGRAITVVADHDDAGVDFARRQAAQLESTQVLMPPTPGHDVSDHLDAGGSLTSLVPVPAERR